MATKVKNIQVGDNIQFKAERISFGNPVKGKLVSMDKEWIEVELEHDIEGLVNGWAAGEKKQFRRTLISNIKVL